MQVNHFLKLDMFEFRQQKQGRVYLRNCVIISLVHVEMLNSCLLFIIVLRSKNNKEVTFAVHTNRMKPFVHPALRQIKQPTDNEPSEP